MVEKRFYKKMLKMLGGGIMLAVIFSAFSMVSDAASENLAYKKTVTVTSTESSSYSGANAVDADGNTRWSSGYSDYQNFVVDLGKIHAVSSVKIAWEDAYALQYQIQVSTDRVNWTTVYSNYQGTGGTETISFAKTAARYVKLYCIKRATAYGFSVYEFEIYGSSSSDTAGNPLAGKQFFFLGSSVTYGYASRGVSFVDDIVRRNDCTAVKEAVSGTTLVDNGSDSYVQRMINNMDKGMHCDHFICQLSTNDASQKLPLGKVSTSVKLKDFDTSTVIGAMEYIICYAKETWNCPVSFYTGTYYHNEHYQSMVDALYELQKKWGIGIIDLWNNEEMRKVSGSDYERYMSDSVHPTAAGYSEWWTPFFEQYLKNYPFSSETPVKPDTLPENLAYKKTVTVTSTESSSYMGANAVDADGNTRWSSGYTDYQNFVVDLGKTHAVSSVKIAWEDAYALQYQIQTSVDRVNWTTVYSNYQGTGGTETISFAKTDARYVKLYCIKRATAYGFSVYEFEIYE